MRSLLNRKNILKFYQTLSRSTGSRFSTLSKGRQTLSEQSESKGFTIVELIIVISIIGILAAIGIVSYNGWRQSTNVTQLKSDLNGVTAAMENARTFGDAYPASVPSTFTPSRGVALFGGSTDGGETYCVTVVNSQFPTVYYHIDSADVSEGAQLGSCSLDLVTIAGTGGTATKSGTSPYSLNDTPTITATPHQYFSFSSWTGDTGCSGTASHPITMNTNKSCTANFEPTTIAAPTAPAVSVSTPYAISTYSWGAASCPGNTARYQYRFTYSGYDSGLIATTSTSVAFTTSTEYYTYTVAVQAQCYNTATTSGWSTIGSGSYYKPHFAATGCTISYSGGYTIHKCTSTGQTFAPNTSGNVEYLIVAGGGGGSQGGGGAGGYLAGTQTVPNNSFTITVGSGGSAGQGGISYGGNGGNSIFGTQTAVGGGGGNWGGEAPRGAYGIDGGSGGGSSYGDGCAYGGSAVPSGQGYGGGSNSCQQSQYPAGAGGGAGGVGGNGASNKGGIGGIGKSSSITGSSVCYAGGGAGGTFGASTPSTATCGGGYDGTQYRAPMAGTPNTGGGGGGMWWNNLAAGGGSGIVVVRYPT